MSNEDEHVLDPEDDVSYLDDEEEEYDDRREEEEKEELILGPLPYEDLD